MANDDDYVRDSNGRIQYVEIRPGSKVPLTKKMVADAKRKADAEKARRDALERRARDGVDAALPGQVLLPGYGYARPVKDRKGNVLYYADPITGERINAGRSSGPGLGQTHDTAHEARQAVNARTKRQDATTGEYPDDTAEEPRPGERYVWIDGHQATVVIQKNGSWAVKYTDGTKDKKVIPPSAFGALDEIDPSAPFVMSNYRLGNTSKPTTLGNIFGNIGEKVDNGGRNLMTIEGGLAWLSSLSIKDQPAYQAMLQKLVDAGYLSNDDRLQAGGTWSTAVGSAFSKAAMELAVVNASPGGDSTTLDDWLQQKITGGAGASATAYKPVERSYTDPEDLKAAAITTAQQTLGRRLTAAEEQELVSHFRGLEDAMYNAQDAAGRQGQNGTYTRPGSGEVDAFVDSGPREQEGANFRTAQYGEALKQLFSQTTNLA